VREDGSRSHYALVHAGRQVRLGPIAFWIVVGTLVIMAVWTGSTATYFAFHDDILTRLIARQAEMQFAYEDRITELRAQVDRMSSRQLLDQEQFEQRLQLILRRQATLESRASTLATFPDSTVTSSIKPAKAAPTKPTPMNETAAPGPVRDRRSGLGIGGVVDGLENSLDRVEARQAAAAAYLEQAYSGRVRHIRGVLADLGIDPAKLASKSEPGATGGPYVPARLRPDADKFERQVYQINISRLDGEQLNRSLASMPVRKPVPGQVDPSSQFGMRIDPFLHSPAMHTGMDLQAETGDAVRATANGKVSVAGWQGGYGKMVEITHGNGLATRYGHLSVIEVEVGQLVRTGQILGRAGTTGRSTGPHLHYETRVNGEAVDPQRFLRAGARLGVLN
jgi:murein DD-endopeptidase MepM/ murein hydrolase activator NlpD